MGAIEGVIVLSSTNEPILNSHFTHPLTSYPSFHTDQLAARLEASRSRNDVLPVLFTEGIPAAAVASRATNGDRDDEQGYDEAKEEETVGASGAALIHIEHNRLRFIATFSVQVDPLVPLTFLRRLLVNLELYLGSPLTEDAIRENFDVVYQVLEEMLDESGQPLNTEYNTLRELVREPSWLDSVFSKVGAMSGISTNAALGNAMSQPHISPIPWRRPASSNHRTASRNEMYVDVVERLSGVYSRAPQPRVIGPIGLRCQLEANCKLGGTPDVLLRLSDTKRILDASLHQCVRIPRWKKERVLSFVPPEGQFELADFRLESVGALERHVPIEMTCSREEKRDTKGQSSITTFRIALRCSASSAVEDVEVLFGIAERSAFVESSLSGGSKPGVASEDLSALKGTFHYDAKLGLARWTIGKLSADQRPIELHGTIKSDSASAGLSTCVTGRFAVPQKTLSGLKVSQLDIVNDVGYKPFKGVRSLLKGDMDWRW